jgi:hypothetical protein
MVVKFACGHGMELGDNPNGSPVCGCGEKQIARVQARAPRFTGVATGPFAEFKNLGPATVNCAPGGSLTITTAKD